MSWEVPTMQSKTSYFNRTLFCKDLVRFWPLWAIYGAAWLFFVPVTQFLTLFGEQTRYAGYNAARAAADAMVNLLETGTLVALWMALIFGCIFAMALFSYLYSARSVGMMHSFPIRREGLFLTHYLAGCAVFVGTLLLSGVLCAGVHAAAGILEWKNLAIWFACAAGKMLFFYSLAVFCAMFTGQILAVPAFYLILNGLVPVVVTTVESFASGFLYGYQSGGFPAWLQWLAPAVRLARDVRLERVWQEELWQVQQFQGLGTVAVYAAAGLVLAGLALVTYRLRRSETAGDVVSVGWARQLFRFGAAVCAALTLGQFLAAFLLGQFFWMPGLTGRLAVNLACMALLALVGFFTAEMLLKKSFRVLRSGWKGALLSLALVAALGAAVKFDLLGVENRIPDMSRVDHLRFSIHDYGYGSLHGTLDTADTDPALLAALRDLHRTFIEEKETLLAREEADRMAERNAAAQLPEETHTGELTLTYIMGDTTLNRSYSLDYRQEDLEDPDSLVSRLAVLAREPALQKADLAESRDLAPEEIGERLETGEMQYVVTGAPGEWQYENHPFGGDTAKAVYQALLRDIDEGRAGARMFRHMEEYINDLTFYYSDTAPMDTGYPSTEERWGLRVSISESYTETIAALRELGIVTEERPLLTYQQVHQDPDVG